MSEVDELVDDIESFQEVDSLERGLASGKKYVMETNSEVYQEAQRDTEKVKEILDGPLTDETLQKYGWGILCDDF